MNQPVLCGGCSHALAESQTLPPEQRTPCPQCGSLARKFHIVIHETIPTLRDSLKYKARRGGKGKPFAEGKSGQEFRRASGKWVDREYSLDREKDEYKEKVTDPDTGEVLHECQEPLSVHQGRGAARKKDC